MTRIVGSLQVNYANYPCPTCGANVLQPCHAKTGYNYDFRYTHARRRRLWWSLRGSSTN